MDDYIKTSIFNLLFYSKTSFKETKIFSKMKHNKDLVPAFNNKLNTILEHYDRYHKISYDIQGIKDRGIDVLVKYELDNVDRQIGIQIKSYDDLEQNGWLTKLKAQTFEAIMKNNNIEDFYIAFCTDIAKHEDKIRNATAELININGTHINILRPEHSLYFMNLNDYVIGSYLKRKLSADDDPIVTDAKESLEKLTLAQTAMVIEIVSLFIHNGKKEFAHHEITTSLFVNEVYNNYLNIPSELYGTDEKKMHKLFKKKYKIDKDSDFQLLCEDYIQMETYTDKYLFSHESHLPLISIMYEAMARFGYNISETKWYMINLLKNLEIEFATKVKNGAANKN